MSRIKIVFIGNLSVKKEIVRKECNNINIKHKEIEYISYEEATNYNYSKLINSTYHLDVIVGPTPHMGKSIGNNSSIITALEKSNNINVIRVNDLKLTKTSIHEALLKTDHYIYGGEIC